MKIGLYIIVLFLLGGCSSYVKEADKNIVNLPADASLIVMRTFGPKGGGNLIVRPVHLDFQEGVTSFVTLKLNKKIDVSEAGVHGLVVQSGYCYGLNSFDASGLFSSRLYDINVNAYSTDKINPGEIVYVGDLIFMYKDGYLVFSVKNKYDEVKEILKKEYKDIIRKYPLRPSLLKSHGSCK